MAEKNGKAKRLAGGAAGKSGKRFTTEEQAAMRERAQELRAASRRGTKADDAEQEVLAKIAAMPEPDRAMATRIHAMVRANAPILTPKTWYGMPAYANAAGQVVCFFQARAKFKTRYATLGFSDKAALDEGRMWPSAFALTALDAATEARIAALVARAAG